MSDAGAPTSAMSAIIAKLLFFISVPPESCEQQLETFCSCATFMKPLIVWTLASKLLIKQANSRIERPNAKGEARAKFEILEEFFGVGESHFCHGQRFGLFYSVGN